MVMYGNLSTAIAVLVNAALIAYLSLFVVLFAMVMARLTRVGGLSALLAAPAVWVAGELGRTHLFTGFPWVLLGYSQVTVLPIAQVASLFGVFGVSALSASFSAAIAMIAVDPLRTRRTFVPLAAAVLLLASLSLWGGWRIRRADLTGTGEALRVGLLQGNVDQNDKWNAERAAGIFNEYLRMSREAVAQGAGFVVWPESATPYPFGDSLVATEEIRLLARQTGVAILLGSDQLERGPIHRYFNAAFMVSPEGADAGVYRKMHLVPFGEYVPLRQVFFFASRLVEAVSDFSAGESVAVLPVRGHQVSTAICYEIVYPDLVRQFVRAGSELLTTITNDAWFGATSAPYQHFAQASMRAIENGRYLVRAANTGISGIVDPYGRVLAASGLFKPAVIVGDVRFLQATTFYTRTGDLFAYLCVVVTAVLLILVRRPTIKTH